MKISIEGKTPSKEGKTPSLIHIMDNSMWFENYKFYSNQSYRSKQILHKEQDRVKLI